MKPEPIVFITCVVLALDVQVRASKKVTFDLKQSEQLTYQLQIERYYNQELKKRSKVAQQEQEYRLMIEQASITSQRKIHELYERKAIVHTMATLPALQEDYARRCAFLATKGTIPGPNDVVSWFKLKGYNLPTDAQPRIHEKPFGANRNS